MGSKISSRTLTANKLLGLPSPVLLCTSRPDYDKAIADAGCQTVSLNLPLAKVLAGKPEKEIFANVTATVLGLLPKDTTVYLTDYEMLFDPRYRLDVMKLFCEISRRGKLIVKWCGGFDGSSLTYAETGYGDYAQYRVSDYEIACVI